jgi:O-antigen/teichoic acid export membrane protein
MGRFAAIGIVFLTRAFLARLLDTDDFGRFMLLANFTTLAAMMSMGGLNRSLVRFISGAVGVNDRRLAAAHLRTVLRAAACLLSSGSLITFVVCWTLVPYLMPHTSTPTLLAVLVAATVALSAAHQLIAEVLRSLHDLRLATLLAGPTGGPLASLTFLVVLGCSSVWFHPLLTTTVALNLAALGLSLPVALWCLLHVVRRQLPLALDRHVGSSTADAGNSVATFLLLSLPIMITEFFWLASSQTDLWVAGAWAGADDLALYSIARQFVLLASLPTNLANLTITATIPRLHAQGATADLERLVRGSATLAGVPTLLGIGAVAIVAGPLAALLFGTFYAGSATLIIILLLGQVVVACSGPCTLALVVTGNERVALWSAAVGIAIQALLGPTAVRRCGIEGLAVLSAAVCAAQHIFNCVEARRRIGVTTAFSPRTALQFLRRSIALSTGLGSSPQESLR